MTVNKDTILGTSLLKNVIYNSVTQSVSGTALNTFLYTANVIEFMSWTSTNSLQFDFTGLPVHKKVIVRAKVYTECSSQNKTVAMTLSGGSPATKTLSAST